jgi:hypothetical protein
MKSRELIMRYFKARALSWLTVSTIPVMIPGTDSPVVLAVYHNGKYISPEVVHIPNDPRDLWGPDGPISKEPPPDEGGEDTPHEH